MEITLEQVEQLREKTGVTYAQAKQALEYSGGNLLDAIIYLEERGAIPRDAAAPAAGYAGTVSPGGKEGPEGKRKKAGKRSGEGGLVQRQRKEPVYHLTPLAH